MNNFEEILERHPVLISTIIGWLMVFALLNLMAFLYGMSHTIAECAIGATIAVVIVNIIGFIAFSSKD